MGSVLNDRSGLENGRLVLLMRYIKHLMVHPQLSFKPLETVAVTKQAMCLAVSPYVPGEGVVVTETGGMYLWRCGQGVTTMRAAVLCDNSNDSPWYQCVFAANPQCIAIANAKALDLLDFRVSSYPFFFKWEKMLRIQHSFAHRL